MKNEFVKIILDFAEGRMSAEAFWELWKTDSKLRELIINCPNRPDESRIDFDPVTLHTKNIDLNSYRNSSELYTVAKKYLLRNKIEFTPNDFYNDRYKFLIQMQPEWLDIDMKYEPFLISIVESAPENLSKAQKLKWCKDQIKTLFKYDNKPPRWVQHAEWPIKDGKPLVFRGQSKERTESELVKFFFYDPETGEETIVEQYY